MELERPAPVNEAVSACETPALVENESWAEAFPTGPGVKETTVWQDPEEASDLPVQPSDWIANCFAFAPEIDTEFTVNPLLPWFMTVNTSVAVEPEVTEPKSYDAGDRLPAGDDTPFPVS